MESTVNSLKASFKLAKPQSYDIKDKAGNVFSILHYGCMTPNEYRDQYAIRSKIDIQTPEDLHQLSLSLATSILSHRGFPGLTEQDVLEAFPSHDMIDAIASYATNEFQSWRTNNEILKIESDTLSESVVKLFLSNNSGVAATNDEKTWYIFENLDKVPEHFSITMVFDEKLGECVKAVKS